MFHVHLYPRHGASLHPSGPARLMYMYLAGAVAGKMELTRHCLLCWRCLLAFLYFTNTMHCVHGLSEWIVCARRVLLLTCHYAVWSTARYSEFILAHSLCSALTAVLFSTAHAHTRVLQVYTYPSHSYINSYHSALMLQFSVFQNHLNPDLLSDGL